MRNIRASGGRENRATVRPAGMRTGFAPPRGMRDRGRRFSIFREPRTAVVPGRYL